STITGPVASGPVVSGPVVSGPVVSGPVVNGMLVPGRTVVGATVVAGISDVGRGPVAVDEPPLSTASATASPTTVAAGSPATTQAATADPDRAGLTIAIVPPSNRTSRGGSVPARMRPTAAATATVSASS